MKEMITKRPTCRWRKFSHKSYAAFCSMKREVNIGVLAVSTLTFANPLCLSAQETTTHENTTEHQLEEVQVTGSRTPLTLGEAARMVTVLSREDINHAAVHSINDLLKYVAGVDVRQRGAYGVQTDIGIRGGTSDQITILLNGVNISNPQTGHNAADFPVSLDDIERIEILKGLASRVYGTSAFSGAINIVTSMPQKSRAKVNLSGGMHGLAEGSGVINFANARYNNQFSGGYSRSDGYTANSDFSIQRAYYQGSYSHPQVDVHWQAGYINKDYGANTFYSASFPDQFEHTRRWITSVRAETKGWLHFTPSLSWNRDLDRFELTKGKQEYSYSKYNYHRTDVYGINLNSYFTSLLGKTSFGAEFRNEGIVSTKLGTTLKDSIKISGTNRYYTNGANRSTLSYYAEHNFLLPRFSLSMGLMAMMNTGLDQKFRFYPGIDASYRLATNPEVKVYGSWNKALRMPTFTDLYYTTTVTHVGNPNLKPEESQSFELGSLIRIHGFTARIAAFYHRGKNMIDWIQTPTTGAVWYCVNQTRVNSKGIETDAMIDFRRFTNHEGCWLKTLHVSYTYIYQDKKIEPGYNSQYALDYMRHQFIAQLSHRLFDRLSADWSVRWIDRVGMQSFALADLKFNWQSNRYTLYAEGDNLFNRHYYDIVNVPQPGFWGKVGFSYQFNL